MLEVLLFLGGLFSGVVNVLAGGGSFLTLPILGLYGLSTSVANGTNRIGILLQNVSATWRFITKKELDIKNALFVTIPTIIGAVVGTSIVLSLPEKIVKITIGIIFLFMSYFVLFTPKVWEEGKKEKSNRFLSGFVFFLIGIYGGYIQAGVGFFLIYALTMLEGYNIKQANAMKIFLTLMFTIFSLILFSFNNKVALIPGLILGAGSFVGGYLGSYLNSRVNKKFIRYVVAGMMIFSAINYLFFR
ncbi:hypothetical protein SAMN04488510_12421 [Fervidobacterium changbaicum]|uniref:Probable membrane transporter protein n=2 Tax=Fervidobacterium TaxID=2422 RepID=A0AAI8CLC9_FERIS|nr:MULTISPECIES: sulfite exporter TauE/SafE family protein [Fervidobacterium]AMW32575.1 sulfite exporter TauE/SafE family protein [Fervidobacterium islandicum]QAV32575.1 sulfite exporter TauE/SafE family protein [Fervidobacterium changbaicum]SDH66477.1 hypothetical protein SAMN04488510_12421 [Fervidobacterium changbaicum]